MRRIALLLLILLTSCRSLAGVGIPPSSITPGLAGPIATLTASPSALPPSAAVPPGAAPGPVATRQPTATATPIPAPLYPDRYTVQFHPEDGLYVGDQVSMEVISPPNADLKGKSLQIQLGGFQGTKLGTVPFGPYGSGNRSQATLTWGWNTRGLAPGVYVLSFSVLPGGPFWSENVTLQPESALPYAESQAQWASAQSQCCVFYYVTGTAAERDIQQIMRVADAQAADAAKRMGTNLEQPIHITLLPRMLGNGGFTSQDISVSYLDRNYGGDEFAIILHHEMIHALDARLGGDLRPTLFLEGLAVYESGGHFRQEPLLANAAALLQMSGPPPQDGPLRSVPLAGSTTSIPTITPAPTGTPALVGQIPSMVSLPPIGLIPPVGPMPATPTPTVRPAAAAPGWFLPLRLLADNFYDSQHEIGYLEAASLITYMVERWGWDSFNKFYRDIHNRPGGSQADAIDAALKAHFGISLDDLQTDYLDRLRQEPVTPANLADVRGTVAYFVTMRRYQELLDPSAYFHSVWLLDNGRMRVNGIVADYLRHPSAPDNLALETMLIAANQAWQALDYPTESRLLGAVNAVLDRVESGRPDPFNSDPLAVDYQGAISALLKAGYEPQRLTVNETTAQAWVTAFDASPIELDLRRTGGHWIVLKGTTT